VGSQRFVLALVVCAAISGAVGCASDGASDAADTNSETSTTDAPEATTTSTSTTTTAAAAAEVSGVVNVTWFLPSDVLEAGGGGAPNCLGPGVANSYQVRVTDGAGDIVAVSPLTEPREISRSQPEGGLLMTCGFDYVATLSESPAFTFDLVSSGSEVKDSQLTSSVDLESGSGPTLETTFSPGL
jgi:hypothetical protein